jgi:hypothetical protein
MLAFFVREYMDLVCFARFLNDSKNSSSASRKFNLFVTYSDYLGRVLLITGIERNSMSRSVF